jgi:membrane associated rhomboid family serine protease
MSSIEEAMHEPWALCTMLVIGITCLVSYFGFRNPALEEKYMFCPERILAGKEYYRLVTSAFLHAGWGHLLWNMIGLYCFGRMVEWTLGPGYFLLIYFGSVIGGNLLSLYVHRHHEYLAYGASGGAAGIIFGFLLLFPGARVALYLALPIPGWLYAVGFIVGSFVAMARAKDNIGHDAHLGGAIVGLLITAAVEPEAARENLIVFLLVLVPAVLLLVYLWVNPMFLPLPAFLGRPQRIRKWAARPPTPKKQARQVDAILEKIAREGMQSLTAEERALLNEVSGKYRRRADSRKPDSGLAI